MKKNFKYFFIILNIILKIIESDPNSNEDKQIFNNDPIASNAYFKNENYSADYSENNSFLRYIIVFIIIGLIIWVWYNRYRRTMNNIEEINNIENNNIHIGRQASNKLEGIEVEKKNKEIKE